MKTPKIVVVGSVNTDMVVKSSRIPAVGETISGGRFVMAAGGKGANQAVAAARLGAEVTFVAKVGHDVFGDQALANFRREGIRIERIGRDRQQATGVALILVDGQGRNLISVAPGANFTLMPEEVQQAADAIRAADVLLLQLEVPLDSVRTAAEIAAAAGVRVILNPAPAAPLDDALLRHVSLLTPNETEAQQLTGVTVNDESGARSAAAKLMARGVGQVIVTLGAGGSLLLSRGGSQHFPATPVEAIDTTAAGDAFNGGLACALGQGRPLEEAIAWANCVGALATTRLGAQPSMPTLEELQQFLAARRPAPRRRAVRTTRQPAPASGLRLQFADHVH